MQLLDVSTDLGPAATPAVVEGLVRGLRVATDVAHEAETSRLRRSATERMKFPTDRELLRALEQLPDGAESETRRRVERQLDARRYLRDEGRQFPPELWYEYWYRSQRSGPKRFEKNLSRAGYDRIAATPFPFVSAPGLDALDPDLYEALVANELAQSLPGRVRVRSLRYENPFWATLFGKGAAEKTVSTTVEVIEVARDFGAKRKVGKAEAAVAEATVDDRIAESNLDVALRQEELRQARLRTERLALENAALRQALGAEEQRRFMIDRAIEQGKLGIADALRATEASDILSLAQLGRRELELVQQAEDDER